MSDYYFLNIDNNIVTTHSAFRLVDILDQRTYKYSCLGQVRAKGNGVGRTGR